MYLDAKTLETEIAQFTPLVKIVAGMIPGTAGTTIVKFLTAVTAPSTIEAVVNVINEIDGATPPPAA